MKWIIIDSVVNRAQLLQKKLFAELQVASSHIRFLDETSLPADETIYLIHNSDGYVDDFSNKSKTLKDTFVIFYSGGGLSLSSLKARGATIGFYSGVLQNGDEHDFVSLLLQVKDVLSKDERNLKGNFEFFFGHDPILESKLNFLHFCLTPDALNRITWYNNGVIEIQTKLEPGEEKNERIGELIDNEAREIFELLKAKSDGPFGEEYITALRNLRNKLLDS